MSTVLSAAFTLFLIINALGMTPVILTLIKDLPPARQYKVLLREASIALVFILVFAFIGKGFFDWLAIDQSSIQIAGGIVLFIIALKMIFPHLKTGDEQNHVKDEPFIVPIATPLLAGPAALTTAMIQSHSLPSMWYALAAIITAWTASLIILLLAPRLRSWIGIRGLNALERLMGLILTLLAVQMLMMGISGFLNLIHSS